MEAKGDGLLNDFQLDFADWLRQEYNFIEQVAGGELNARPGKVQKYAAHLCQVVNFAADNAPAFGGNNLVSIITGLIEGQLQKQQNAKITTLKDALPKHFPKKRDLMFQQIAREMMYRYGACICHLQKIINPDEWHTTLAMLARTGAIRILHYALHAQVDLENCQKLVAGVFEGFDDYPEKEFLTKLTEGLLRLVDTNKRQFSCEGLYTRSGFHSPGHLFWIHSDYDRQQKGGKGAGRYVSFSNLPKATGVGREHSLVPKYGYISVPTREEPERIHYRRHKPVAQHNEHAAICAMFKYRYVSLHQIVEYLKSPNNLDFSAWLVQGPYAQEFSVMNGVKVSAIFRGILDAEQLQKKGVNFKDGRFNGVDFSYCTFRGLYFADIKSSRLVSCTFTDCVASGDACSYCNFSMSTIDRCKLENLSGLLNLSFARLFQTNLSTNGLILTGGEDMELDDFTVQSMSTSHATVKTPTGGTLDLYQRFKELMLQREEREKLEREKHEMEISNMVSKQLNEWILQHSASNEQNVYQEKEQSDRLDAIEARLDSLHNVALNAIDKGTINSSIESIIMPKVTDNPITKVFEALFFLKPMKFLKILVANPNIVTWSSLPRKFIYSTSGVGGSSGEDGEDGSAGASGGAAGTDGTSGVDGQHGTPARPNTISIMSVPNQRIFMVTPEAYDSDTMIMPLYDGDVRINLSAVGGKGGKGGDGGKGGNGRAGINGKHATSSRTGTAGTNGGNGGRGGNGGMGGNAGHSADITVMVKGRDVDLLSLLGTVEHGASSGGAKGNCGVGGTGGSGGRGGDSHRYKNGDNWVTNSGGANGANGAPGNDGRDGQAGKNGMAGNFVIRVVDVSTGEIEEYRAVYALQLTALSTFWSSTGIIEPGQKVEVSDFTVYNTGGMPTPASGIVVSMQGNSVVQVDDAQRSWKILQPILSKQAAKVAIPLKFRVSSSIRQTYLKNSLFVESDLPLCATYPRTAVQIKNFQLTKAKFTVTHPIELSLVVGSRASVFDCAVPVTITVRNKSRLGLGLRAVYPRMVRVTLDLPNADTDTAHTFATKPTGVGVSLLEFACSSTFGFEVEFIPGRSQVSLCGAISLSPQSAALYDQVNLSYSLLLGNIDRPMKETELDVVQQKTHEIQVAEYAKPIIDSDCVLVVSSATTAAEVDYWRQRFAQIGSTTCVFNVSLYHGLSYKFPSYNFCESVQGRVVVILNCPFYRDDIPASPAMQFFPLDYLEQSEMFEAARRHGVRTYVINYATSTAAAGGNAKHHTEFGRYIIPMAALSKDREERDKGAFSGRTRTVEHLHKDEASRDEKQEEKYYYCRLKLFRFISKPTEKDYDQRMLEMVDKLKKNRPDHSYYLSKCFENAVKGSNSKALVFRRYDCGHVELRRGLDTSFAMLASTTVQQNDPVQQRSCLLHEFVLLKLLPFDSKLALFSSTEPGSPRHNQVTQAIASDIVDEVDVIFNCLQCYTLVSSKRKDRMRSWLTALGKLETFDFSDVCGKEGGVEALTNLLLQLNYIASSYSRMHRINSNFLAAAVSDSCFAVMKSYLGITTDGEFAAKTKEYKEAQTESNEEAAKRMRDPLRVQGHVLLSHWMQSTKAVILKGHEVRNSPPTLSLMRPELPNMAIDEVYQKEVKFLSRAPKYDIQQLPSLYPVHPSEKLMPEVPVNRVASYSAFGSAVTAEKAEN